MSATAYYQPAEPALDHEDELWCVECDDVTVHQVVADFRSGPVETECLDCGHFDEIETD